MHARHASDLAIGAEHLQADALEPDVVALLVPEAVLERETARPAEKFGGDPIGRGGGILGMQQVAPRFQGGVELVLGVPELFLPGRRIVERAGLEIEVKHPGWAALGQKRHQVVARIFRHDRLHKCETARAGGGRG